MTQQLNEMRKELRTKIKDQVDLLYSKFIEKGINIIIKSNHNRLKIKDRVKKCIRHNMGNQHNKDMYYLKIYTQYELNKLCEKSGGAIEIDNYLRPSRVDELTDRIKNEQQVLIQYMKEFEEKKTKSAFGSAGRRSKNQKKKVKDNYDRIINQLDEKSVLLSTDGASRGNPGCAGSGGVIIFGNDLKNCIKFAAPINKTGTNNMSELYAIQVACMALIENDDCIAEIEAIQSVLDVAALGGIKKDQNNEDKEDKIKIILMSDSSYALDVLQGKKKATKNRNLIKKK
eukprot:181346_1